MKNKYTFIIYTKPKAKQFSGILGEIDVYRFQLLLAGGKYIIEEQYQEKDAIKWYISILEQQGIIVANSKQQKYKGDIYIWLEVDSEKTPISEFTMWNELDKEDNESLAWKTFYYPCKANTNTECLGFGIVARETIVSAPKRSPIYLNEVFDGIFQATA